MKKLVLFTLFCITSTLFSQSIALQSFATGFSSPVAIVNAGDSRLFVVQRGGAIRILNANGTINATNFLTIPSTTVLAGGERGLLGLAFHPNYATNGYFYVNYTRVGDGATVIARYSVNTTDANIANPASAQILLTVSQPYSNHNGGSLAFGPDGYLYIGMGDGGSGGDPQNYAQNINSLLGKMLRIDVDNGTPYSIPAGNPFAGATPGADEIWAVGVRNPWKFSFDRNTGDLWIADVGQNSVEEINKALPTEAGLNYGWKCYEGNSVFSTVGCGPIANYKFPIATYPYGGGYCSVTGGYSYTGLLYPNFQNKYFFADYCANRIGWIPTSGGTITWTAPFSGGLATFGEDVNGELYVAGVSGGIIYKINDTSLGTADFVNEGFSVYPNPAEEMVTLKNPNLSAIKQIVLNDASGKIVGTFHPTTGTETTLSVQNLTSGIYFLSIETANGEWHRTKLMKN
ncbi:PQQ-dependent sugar dehydrogenase [Flavobacterium orientale]|uniref:Glucose dehydrogenase n=1 Tax=Flavobacterium orientale TaxID=1756020 RepID=A0A916XWT7_9FLAO|nr:PQQ-dependent sugar dehydrogenase [Flavobacterium orientale]GGD18244.1 glucose dehydrogenase [Flavobacterium orientale]